MEQVKDKCKVLWQYLVARTQKKEYCNITEINEYLGTRCKHLNDEISIIQAICNKNQIPDLTAIIKSHKTNRLTKNIDQLAKEVMEYNYSCIVNPFI